MELKRANKRVVAFTSEGYEDSQNSKFCVAFTFLPSNGQTRKYIEATKIQLAAAAENPVYARAEDIPYLLDLCAKQKKSSRGITGKDLWSEYELRNPQTTVKELSSIPWFDGRAQFGRPALCLLAPKGFDLRRSYTRLVVNEKYRELANDELNKQMPFFRRICDCANGQLEGLVQAGLFEGCIEIVYTGETARKAGLEIRAVLFESDLVVLEVQNGNK